jgi:hypothetical protein
VTAATDDEILAPGRPVFLGCVAMIGLAVFIVAGAIFFVTFLESGSATGRIVLEDARAYPAGSVVRNAENGFYLVRLADGSFLALADLDAANRAASGNRCKVAPLAQDDPDLPAAVNSYGSRRTPAAIALALIFREDCNGALYDASGARLDADGRSLDRYDVSTNAAGRVVVDTARRSCSARAAGAAPQAISC